MRKVEVMSFGEFVTKRKPVVSSVEDERRRSERLLLTIPIPCSVTLAEQVSNDGLVFNVSTEGMRIMTMSVLPAKPGDAITLCFVDTRSNTMKTMHIRAVVRWRERQEFGLEIAA
jgi:hypothetical protein